MSLHVFVAIILITFGVTGMTYLWNHPEWGRR
jgi:hypothetical protein